MLLAVTLVTASPAIADRKSDFGFDCGWRSGWSQPNADKSGTRNVRGPISSRTVSALRTAWTVPIKAPTGRWPGTYAATPVVVGGVVYTQDLDSNVYAIDLRTGRELWTTMFESHTNGPNGVAVANGMVFGGTLTDAFGLDARTGRIVWQKRLSRGTNEALDMAPGVNNGTVYISTVPSFMGANGPAGTAAVLWAIDGRTGKTKWKWDTVPADLWGHPEVNSGGGLWYPPTFDRDGDLYVAVANPNPFLGTPEHPWASSRPGPNLYSNSIVKLDDRTGRVIWYNQVLPHDVYDWDLQNSPILTTVRGRQVVVATGKPGYVYLLDQRTGRQLWKTPVGKHNGHDDDNLIAMSGDLSKMPQFPVEVFPGALGGAPAPSAVDSSTVYVAVNNFGAIWTNQFPPPIMKPFNEGEGEVVAVDLATGRKKWSYHVNSSPYGAASVTNDLVFTTTFDGTVYAINTKTGKLAWQDKLPGGSNSPVALHGDTLLAASGWPQSDKEEAKIVAYRLDRGRADAAGLTIPSCR